MKGRPHTFAQPTIYRSTNGGGFKKKLAIWMLMMMMMHVKTEMLHDACE